MTARSALVAGAILASAGGAKAQAEDVLLTAVNVVDVGAGIVAGKQSILVEEGVIAAIGADIGSTSAERSDVDGAYVIPGLWDSHAHVFSSPAEPETALPLYLIHGVTGIRDMGALWRIGEQQALQQRIESGETLGTSLDAGQGGMENFGRVTMACATAEDEIHADLRAATDTGADRSRIFEIMADLNRIALKTWDQALCEDVLARMAGSGLHVSPTLVVANFYLGNGPAADAPRMRMLPAEVREAWRQPDFRLEAMTDELRDFADASVALDHQTFLMAHEAGVPILAATDASFANPCIFHGASLLDEIDRYVEMGLTPREAFFSATVAPPRFFGLADQNGSIAHGRRADFVLLDVNPLEDLSTLRRPGAVIVGGTLLDRAALDALEADLLAKGE